MADRRLLPKRNLEIVHAEIDVPYKQNTKYLDRVQAKDWSLPDNSPLAGKPLRMTIFSDTLKHYVRGKTNIIADVEERDRPDSEYGPDRTIVQVYDEEGEPVSKKNRGGGGGNYRWSLEDDLALEMVKRRSIEGQTAIAQVGQVLTSPSDIPGEDLGIDEEGWKRVLGKYWAAVEKGLDNYLDDSPITPSKAPDSAQDKRQPPSRGEAVSNDQPADSEPIKHVGDLLTRSSKLNPPVKRDDLLIACNVSDPSEIVDLEAAWKLARGISETKKNSNSKATVDQETEQLPFT